MLRWVESPLLEPRLKSCQNPLTAAQCFEEAEVDHDLIERENYMKDLKYLWGWEVSPGFTKGVSQSGAEQLSAFMTGSRGNRCVCVM